MRWLVVETHPNKEISVKSELESLAYKCELPLIVRETRHARRIRRDLVPRWRRYVFVEEDDRWRKIRRIRNVVGLLPHYRDPISIRDTCLAPFRAIHDLSPGDHAKMIDWENEVLIERCDGNEIQVMLSLLGRDLKMTVSRDRLQRI